VYVYLPSETMLGRWKNAAKKADVSLSKFVIEHIENEIRGSDDFMSRVEMVRRVGDLEEENELLRKEKSRLEIVVDKLQEDLQTYRLGPFVSSDFEGVREFEQKLVEAFKQRSFIRQDDLWRVLGVNPRHTDAIKAISQQLKILEQYGVIKKTQEGWRWIK